MTKTRNLADLGGGFIQAGTGAVQRTVESKLRDVVNVKDFGAVGNGVTNDTAAIQAAIAAAALANGATVYIPAGTYKANVVLNVSDVNITGDGKGTIIAPSTGDALTCSGISSGRGGTVSNLRLTGTAGASRGLVISGFSRGSLRNLYINEIATGIYIDGDKSVETFFDSIYCHNVSSYGVRYERTNTVDTGGVYFNTIAVTGNSAAVGMSFNSTVAARTRAFAFITNAILDNRAQSALYVKNSTNFFITQTWFTGTAPSTGLVHLENAKDVWMQGVYVQNSSSTGYNFYVDSTVEDVSASVLRLSGPGTDWYFGGTANIATRCRIYSSSSTTTTRSNDDAKASLLLSPRPSAFVNAGQEQTATISSGSIAVTSSRVLVLGEGGAADDLETINGGNTGDLLFLTFGATGYTVTVKHGLGNIRLANGADEVLSGPNEVLTFIKRNTGNWLEVSRSNNQ